MHALASAKQVRAQPLRVAVLALLTFPLRVAVLAWLALVLWRKTRDRNDVKT